MSDINITKKEYHNKSRDGFYWYIKAPRVRGQVLKVRAGDDTEHLKNVYKKKYVEKKSFAKKAMKEYIKAREKKFNEKPDRLIKSGSYTETLTKPTASSLRKFYIKAAERLNVPEKDRTRVAKAMERHRVRHATQVLIYGIPTGSKSEELMVRFFDIGKRSLKETVNHFLSNTNEFKKGSPVTYDIHYFISNYGNIRPEAIQKLHDTGVITKVRFRVTYTK